MQLDPVSRLTRDLRAKAATLSADEARFLVDYYYVMQKDRIRAGHQTRTLQESGDPHDVLAWLGSNTAVLEQQIQRALAAYTDSAVIGRWSKSIVGVGPIIAAGLMAHIDITKAPTVGHIWRFAGLDPTTKWEKKTKRPWNAALKTLTWKIGESFVKVSSNEHDVYGKVFVARKAIEIARNLEGAFADQAAAKVASVRIGADTDAILWYTGKLAAADARTYYETPAEQRQGLAARLAKKRGGVGGVPMLPPAHIHARARRYAVKLFLSHWQHVAWESTTGAPPPRPYILSHGEHAHFIAPPNWPMAES